MSASRSTRLMKGALVSVSSLIPIPTVVLFQYNPESLNRSLQPQMEGGSKEKRTEPVRFTGAPIEEITVELDIDAIDQLERGDATAQKSGILPQLAALEIMVYPSSIEVITQAAMLALGTIEITPTPAPTTLFVYGSNRVLPVRIVSYSANETDHDTNLNPIRARVSLHLRVLTYSDLSITDLGYSVFLAHQISKETMAMMTTASNISNLLGVDLSKYL